MFCFFLAEQLKKDIGEILNMPSTELYWWVAYYSVKKELEEKEIEKVERKAKSMNVRRPRLR